MTITGKKYFINDKNIYILHSIIDNRKTIR